MGGVLAGVDDVPPSGRRCTGEVPMPVTVPPSLLIVLQALRPCFTAPSFATLSALVTGALSGAGRRTITGMWQAAGLAGSVHWSRAPLLLPRGMGPGPGGTGAG